MGSLDSVRERFGRTRLLWQTRLAAYCVGLDEDVPLAVVTALDDGCDFGAIEREAGVRICSLERAAGRRDALDDLGIERLVPAVEGELAAILDGLAEPLSIVSPYPSATLAEFASRRGIHARCLDWDTFWWFSHKANLLAGVAELGLPRLPGRWDRLAGLRFSELASEFGLPFVVQGPLGAAGSGTAFVGSEAEGEAADLRFGGSEVWIAPFAGRLSYNVNAVATGSGTAVGYPSVQIVGQAALNGSRAGHCGNDFSATAGAPRAATTSVREQTSRIGDWMSARGYRGLFGLDFVVDDSTGRPCAVDLNPRWQGSTSLACQAERRQGRLPLAAAEIAFQLGLMEAGEVMRLADAFFEPLEGSQVFPKNRGGSDWTAGRALRPGIYSPAMEFLRPGLRLRELGLPPECLLNGGIPLPGRPIAPGVTLLRMSSLRAAVDPATGRLEPWVERAARALYDLLALAPAG